MVFLGILGLGITLRYYRLEQPQLWLDELLRLVRFSSPDLLSNLRDISADVAAVPLDYLVQNFFVWLWGVSEFSARFHAALCGSLSLLVFYGFVRQVLNQRTAQIATLMLAVFPLHLFYSREGANYSLFFLLSLPRKGSYHTLPVCN